MNITPAMLYWLTRLDEISCLIGIICLAAIVVCIVNIIGGCIALDDACTAHTLFRKDDEPVYRERSDKRFKRALRIGLLVALPLALAETLIPSAKQMAAIIVVPKIANSEVVAEMGDTAKELVVLAKAWLVELKPKKGGGQ